MDSQTSPNTESGAPIFSEPKRTTVRQFLWEVIKFVVLALLIVVPIRIYVAQPYIVNGSSMDPTFKDGDYLIVDQLTYRFHRPERGDVIVLRFPQNPSKFFIKRVIGLPGESLKVADGVLTVSNEGVPFVIQEPYAPENYDDTFSIELKEKEYFVMGDNRSASLDSRIWGPLEERFVVGKALLRLLPINAIDVFPGSVAADKIEHYITKK